MGNSKTGPVFEHAMLHGRHGLSREHQLVCDAIREGDNLDEAAEHAGVSRRTVFNWRIECPQFDSAIEEAKNDWAEWARHTDATNNLSAEQRRTKWLRYKGQERSPEALVAEEDGLRRAAKARWDAGIRPAC